MLLVVSLMAQTPRESRDRATPNAREFTDGVAAAGTSATADFEGTGANCNASTPPAPGILPGGILDIRSEKPHRQAGRKSLGRGSQGLAALHATK